MKLNRFDKCPDYIRTKCPFGKFNGTSGCSGCGYREHINSDVDLLQQASIICEHCPPSIKLLFPEEFSFSIPYDVMSNL
jgi:hypothetical protein